MHELTPELVACSDASGRAGGGGSTWGSGEQRRRRPKRVSTMQLHGSDPAREGDEDEAAVLPETSARQVGLGGNAGSQATETTEVAMAGEEAAKRWEGEKILALSRASMLAILSPPGGL